MLDAHLDDGGSRCAYKLCGTCNLFDVIIITKKLRKEGKKKSKKEKNKTAHAHIFISTFSLVNSPTIHNYA